jgi:hypothetical protein
VVEDMLTHVEDRCAVEDSLRLLRAAARVKDHLWWWRTPNGVEDMLAHVEDRCAVVEMRPFGGVFL